MNPFQYGNIVSGDFFYDRKEELLRIKQTLKGGNNLMLYAPRRYGKSSLVAKAMKELNKEGMTTVYVDFMSIYSRETFIKHYMRAIAEQQGSALEKVTKKIAGFIRGIIPSVSFDNFGNPTFSLSWVEGNDREQILVDTINLPEKLTSKNNHWIVAFDEFQEITQLNGESFEKILRSCIQHHQNVSYLFLGSRTHLLKDMFNNKNRAFYNAAMLMNIKAMDTEHSINFLSDRFAKDNINILRNTAIYLLNKLMVFLIISNLWQQKSGNRLLTINKKSLITTLIKH